MDIFVGKFAWYRKNPVLRLNRLVAEQKTGMCFVFQIKGLPSEPASIIDLPGARPVCWACGHFWLWKPHD